MGFEAELRDSYGVVKLSVIGMTCHSCVQTITQKLASLSSIRVVNVNLEGKCASVIFDSNLISPEEIANQIELMGFESKVIAETNSSSSDTLDAELTKKQNDLIVKQTCVVNIEGMTCHSCVKNIEETIGNLKGIFSIHVSLQEKRALIDYDVNLWTADAIAQKIDEMGFEARVSQSPRRSELI